jgi:GT2 family glycosyltransferase
VIVVAQDDWPVETVAAPVQVIRMRRPSLTRARNAGIRASTGAVVLFLDDDCLPMEHLAAAHARIHARHPEFAALAGRVLDVNNRGDKARVVAFDEATLEYVCDFGRTGHEEVAAFHGSHMSFKRQVFEAVRFDPWFRGNALCEELDVAVRMRRRGMRILFSSEVRTDHAVAATGGCRSERTTAVHLRNRFFNRAFCFAKNFGLRTVRAFTVKQKRDLEYFSRSKTGHDAALVADGGAGLAQGIAAGMLRRAIGPAVYR